MPFKIPFKRARKPALQHRSGSASLVNTSLSISDVQDMIYIADITIGGALFPVQLDTGSSDLWVLLAPGSQLPDAESSNTNLNISYTIGWAQGLVAFASTDFAGITVSQQAYLNASSAQNPALSYGASGLFGLGFDSLSNIDAALNQTGSSSGRTLLYNLFHDNQSEPNFIAFSLQSTSDDNGVQGSFSVGETDPLYANVTNTNKIPTWPTTSPTRWTVLLDSFIAANQTYSVSSTVPAAPNNKAVTLLDSGTSYSYVPPEVCTAIYGGISGAQFNTGLGQWVVPCGAEIDMALQFEGQLFPINPLDVTPAALGSTSTCVGSFVPQTVGSSQYDWLVGDNVLRSVYTLYDFGDFTSSGDMDDPYVQMLSLVNPDQASIEFHNVRGGTPNTNITYSVSNAGSGSTTVSLSTDVATAIQNLTKYLPVALGIMALNALVLIVLVILGIILLCRRRKNARIRKMPGRPSPMQAGPPSGLRDLEPLGDVPHSYQPVSMALTEDTLFVPPTPSFKNDSSKFGDRPNSIA